MYRSGDGVPKDSAEAVKWFRKAAEQGNAVAQNILGAMYARGDGVPKDLVQAHAWHNIAGAAGLKQAKELLEILEELMTSEQKAEAMKLARETFERIGANKR
jgi:TPR repeat protein